MRITHVDLAVVDLDGAADFYGRVLGLPVQQAVGRAEVTIGASTLRLAQLAPGGDAGTHHLAFTVAAHRFVEAKAWIAARTRVLSSGDDDEFEWSSLWNSRSVYVEGGDGGVLELIARRDLDHEDAESTGPSPAFSASELLGIGEVGIAVPDVARAVEAITATGITPYGAPGERFAAMGDTAGVVILVREGRPWFPTELRVARDRPIRVTAATAGPSAVVPLGESSELVLEHRAATVDVRPTTDADWRRVRAIRLEMLADTPIAFGETLETARARGEADWRRRAARGNGDGVVYFAAVDRSTGAFVGTAGGIADAATGTIHTLVGVYVNPAYRGAAAGVTDALLSAVEDWAGGAVVLYVHELNARAIACYRRRGYEPTGHSVPYVLDSAARELEMRRSG